MKLVKLACMTLMLGGSVLLASTQNAAYAATTTWARVNNVQLRYELSGKGDNTIVLLHEMSMSLESWDEEMPALVPHWRVLRYDLRGFGLSQRIHDAITMDDEVEDLRALLDALDIHGKVTLAGGAVGGAIALKFAATYPERVSGVVAVSPAAYMAPQPDRVPKKDAAPAAPMSAEAMERVQESAYPSVIRKMHPKNYEKYLAIQAASDRAAGQITAAMVYAVGFKDILPKIQCPTVIVATSLFKAHSVADFKELADSIPHGRLEVLETGHFAPIESPEMVSPILTKFLKEVAGH